MEQSFVNNRSEKKRHRPLPVLLILAMLLILGSVSGVLFAKYIITNRQQVAMISAGFHMSSNLLETKTAGNLGSTDKILIELYNFEKENNAQISSVDITYTITVANGMLRSVKNGDVEVPYVERNDVKYYTLLVGADKVIHTITVIPTHTGPVSVTVTSTAPFEKTLSGVFDFDDPTYKIESVEGDLYKLTIYTNGHNGVIYVNMGNDVYPDKTVDLQSSWTGNSGTVYVEDHGTYELYFFGKISSTGSLVTLNGQDKIIQVGN